MNYLMCLQFFDITQKRNGNEVQLIYTIDKIEVLHVQIFDEIL